MAITPPHYIRHDIAFRFLFSYFSPAPTCEYNCAKRDYKRSEGTGKILERTHVRSLSLSSSLSIVAALDSLYRTRGRTIDMVIYRPCAIAKIESYIYVQSGGFIAEVGLYYFCLSSANDSSGNPEPLSERHAFSQSLSIIQQRCSKIFSSILYFEIRELVYTFTLFESKLM